MVIAAEQYASRLVVPQSQQHSPMRWSSHKDHARKALAKLAGPHLPATLKQVEKAIAKTHSDHHKATSRRTTAERGAVVDEPADADEFDVGEMHEEDLDDQVTDDQTEFIDGAETVGADGPCNRTASQACRHSRGEPTAGLPLSKCGRARNPGGGNRPLPSVAPWRARRGRGTVPHPVGTTEKEVSPMPSLEWRERLAALYLTHQLRRQLAAVVNTTPENLEDACMFAWMKLLTHRLNEPDALGGWLLTVARREAIKVDRRARRSHPLPTLEDGSALEAVDPRDHITAVELRAEAAAVIAAAGLSARGQRLVALQTAGLS